MKMSIFAVGVLHIKLQCDKISIEKEVMKMAMNIKNEILEDQRRAREEFLNLKKMQNGEMDAGPKPSEIALTPKTFKEKRENFWFQYKWHTIGIVASVAVFIILVAQCMSVPNYDLSVVYFTYTPVIDNHTDLVAEYFEQYGNGY